MYLQVSSCFFSRNVIFPVIDIQMKLAQQYYIKKIPLFYFIYPDLIISLAISEKYRISIKHSLYQQSIELSSCKKAHAKSRTSIKQLDYELEISIAG